MKKFYTLLLTGMFLLFLSNSLINGQCNGRRPDLNNDFTAQEQIELRNLIMDYLKHDMNNAYPNDPLYDVIKYTVVGIHSGFNANERPFTGKNSWHSYDKKFLKWHRAYIQGLENYLIDRGYEKYVPLPAWDNDNPIPDAFFNDAATDNKNSVLPVSDGFPQLQNQGPCGQQGDITDFLKFDDNFDCSSWSDINSYADELEDDPHDATHGAIRGSMGVIQTASGAAIFWPFHAYVDDLYYCYQKQCMNLNDPDLWLKDEENGTGVEPSSPDVFWKSPGIFSADGWLDGQGNLNIQQVPGESITIAVRVRNRGDMPNMTGVGQIELYWAQASSGLSWPAPFDGSSMGTCNEPMGGFIASQPLRPVNEDYVDSFDVNYNGDTTETIHDYTIYYFEWTPPDPDNYAACFGEGWKQRHFCILARIVVPNETLDETNDLEYNVEHNNEIALRNIALWGNGEPDGIVGPHTPPNDLILVGNYTSSTMNNVKFEITFPTQSDAHLLNKANMHIRLNQPMQSNWINSGKLGNHVNETIIDNRSWIDIQQANATIDGMSLSPYQIGEVAISFDITDSTNLKDLYVFDFKQYNGQDLIGGVRFQVDLQKQLARLRGVHKIGKTKKPKLRVYPNPSRGYFTISSPDFGMMNTIKIYNSMGEVVYKSEFSGKNEEFYINDITPGVYIIQVRPHNSDEYIVEKLVIQ